MCVRMLKLECFPHPSEPHFHSGGTHATSFALDRPHCFSDRVFLLMAPFVRPQDGSTGAIRGVVLDPDGRPIAAAPIALVNSATGAHYAATSDEAGRFSFELLPAGSAACRDRSQFHLRSGG
jgi:hypothetical protein